MSNELPPGLAEAMDAEPQAPPPSDKLADLHSIGNQLSSLQSEISADELALKEKKSQVNNLVHKTLPDLMGELNLDNLGMADLNADMIARNFYKANISAEWDEERRERAFRWLEENGFGSLIKHEVTFSFRRGEENKAHWLVQLVEQAANKRAARLAEAARTEGRELAATDTWDIPSPVVRKAVPHSTLTSLVRAQTELPADDPAKKTLPLDVLGAIVGRIVEIKPRKN